MTYSEAVIEKYFQSLNDMEKKAYYIAKDNLGSSFDITKSIGFLKWVRENKV